MLFVVQLLLALAGIAILLSGRIPVGQWEVRNPLASLIGIILAAALPLTVVLIVVLSGPDIARLVKPAGFEKAWELGTASYWWVRPVMLLLTLGVASGLTWVGVQDDKMPPPLTAAPVVPSAALERAGTRFAPSDAIATSAAPAMKWMTAAAEPDLPPVVGRYTAAPKGIPPEVEALGTAERLFRPSAVGGVASWWEGKKPSCVLVFRQALVTVTGDDFTVVPWNAVEAIAGRTLKTRDGQTVELSPHVEGADQLEWIVKDRVGERLRAEMQPRLDAGEELSFGAFAVTAEELRYDGRSLAWFEIAHVRVFEGRSLHVMKGDSPLPWCMVPRERIANEFLLLEFIGKLAPGSLEAAGAL